MPVRIVKDDERLSFEFMGGDFYYRRPPLKLKKRWVNECTNARGIIDFYGLIERAVPYCLTGWSDKAVVDAEDKPIPFSDAVALSLPEDFYTTFSSQLGLSDPDSDQTNGSLKNSKST
ncbi:hypothetical protein LCGC14_1452750 [marine sediment metagenome]|uniref:Uncharacterized protein n=2 Tax=root TaxID=1 RepID=A0A831QK27_9FLAO|nr:hypothetical protein [Methylophaga sp.]HEA19663.1 hypothetical protein [Pricia antarctica]